jgi:NAD(P)-dependent dehydrogenase (short-subunit alcohol dehydrogenase family)
MNLEPSRKPVSKQMSYLHDLFHLEGKVAAVVGGTGALGSAIAGSLVRAGAQTAVIYQGNQKKAQEICDNLDPQGLKARPWQMDVRNEDSIVQTIADIGNHWQDVEILVNASGINSATSIMDIEDSEWDKIMDINLKGVYWTNRAVARNLIAKGKKGSIINLTSVSSEIPLSKVFVYGMSKAAVNNMTRYMAREWAPDIRVNSIMPGFFPGEQNREILSEERKQSIINHSAIKRYGDPEELCGAVVWLASDKASSFVTGAIVPVDGGFTAMSI